MLRKRDENYLKIDPDNPNIAYYYHNQKHRFGKIKSIYEGKGWKYTFDKENGTIKKVRCYFFREECQFTNSHFPHGIRYRISMVKTHMSDALVRPIINDIVYKDLFFNGNETYMANTTWWFHDDVTDEFVLQKYSEILHNRKDNLEKKLNLINNKINTLQIKQTWSKNGFGEDYKFTDDEDEWVMYV